MKQNGTWNFINGSDWDYCDANVVCRELGECALKFLLTATDYSIQPITLHFLLQQPIIHNSETNYFIQPITLHLTFTAATDYLTVKQIQ